MTTERVTKEQARESLLRVLGKIPSTGDEYEEAAANLHHFIWQSQAVPEGWQLVPVEPTEDIADAFYGPVMARGMVLFSDQYRAMLAAAPKPGGVAS